MGTLEQPYGQSLWCGTQASCQQPAPTYLPYECAILSLLVSVKPSDDLTDILTIAQAKTLANEVASEFLT